MELRFSDDERAFRREVQAFVRDRLAPSTRRKVEAGLRLAKADYVGWQKALHARGWIAPQWPKEHGGTGWTPIQHYIFEEEMALGGAPPLVAFGVNMIGPVLIAFGSEEQKRRHLPGILTSDVWWCQGFSEPGAGSDLASLQTRAVRDGDAWVVSGQKTWTTLAQYADMMFCLARTDPAAKPQEGISFLLIDMKSPGVSVRPIRTIDGETEINEVFLDGVRVAADNLVGEAGKGWTYAKYLLGYERTGIARVGRSKQQLRRVKRVAAAERANGRKLIEDARFRDKIAALEIELIALEFTNLRFLIAGRGSAPGPEASLLKIMGTEIQQRITELLLEAVGPYAAPFMPEALDEGWNGEPVGPDWAAPLAAHYFDWRKVSIYGGSNEIQRNVLAKMLLGL
ncbi:MAG: acyl-CoA dehydrogenase family protein [Pseudomonadota bacterium]